MGTHARRERDNWRYCTPEWSLQVGEAGAERGSQAQVPKGPGASAQFLQGDPRGAGRAEHHWIREAVGPGTEQTPLPGWGEGVTAETIGAAEGEKKGLETGPGTSCH